MIIFGEFGSFEIRVLITAVIFTVMSLVGLANGTNYEKTKSKIAIVGIVLSVVAAIPWAIITWSESGDSKVFVQVTLTITIIAFGLAYYSLASLVKLTNLFRFVQLGSYFVDTFTCTLLLVFVWFDASENEVFVRLLAVAAVAFATVTALLPICMKLDSTDDTVDSIEREIEILRKKIGKLELKRDELDAKGQ